MTAEQDPPEDDLDPTADTPDTDPEDTADEVEQAGSEDWTPKDRREATRKVTEQGQEIARLRAQLEADDTDDDDESDDDDDDDTEDDEPDLRQARLEDESWSLVERSYGPEAVDAYKAYYRAFERSQTPMDHVTALMVFTDRMTNGSQTPSGGAAPATGGNGTDRLAPTVDSNRSDSTPDSADKAIAEAVRDHDPAKGIAAMLKKAGIG